jgi:hypothetical protein
LIFKGIIIENSNLTYKELYFLIFKSKQSRRLLKGGNTNERERGKENGGRWRRNEQA